ncbi:diamine acetyltransferase [Flavobacterium sp. L1I52]|uniref:Diamine acetyltransferase n=1 Tax=Flavobacterium pokkalii TaxID=1940408 RepID=A0ABR7UMP7_9FLAO|nr:GNAT family N-acetyltransferase [Flavobacterium pokkalii]MBD0724151.1 diamine acetyltransferase [Flavobacterium pokkalii]
MNIIIRKAIESDSGGIWSLMKELAIYEKYINSFVITPEIVRANGFKKNPPDFYCLVADDNQKIAGILVYYYLPFTAQNKPSLFIKELYVDTTYRGHKIGEKLMLALKEEAVNNNCGQIKWTVAPWNEGGIRFYNKLGAKENNDWLNYEWNIVNND